MPKLKQPISLERIAHDALQEYILNYCHQLSVKGRLKEFGISVFKKHVCDSIPCNLSADIFSKFLSDFYSKHHLPCNNRIVLDILMDVEIVGLRCKGKIFAHIKPNDVHRLRKLEELDLTHFPAVNLSDFHLDDLTTFIFEKSCCDRDLMVLGQNCPKLEVLKIPYSKVTDVGLLALSPCSELRVVNICDCTAVSNSGIHRLLSVHKKIEEFAHWDHAGFHDYYRLLTDFDLAVCPSMSRFVFRNNWDYEPLSLDWIVEKFPNLTHLELQLHHAISDYLSDLIPCKKLAGIEIKFLDRSLSYPFIEEAWGQLRALLTLTRANITTLKFSCFEYCFLWDQKDLDAVFMVCPNIEHLEFDRGGGLMLIPPFSKLKELYPRIPVDAVEFEFDIYDDQPALEFNKLPSLEILSIVNYGMDLQAIESILFDHVRFPNLSMIKTNCLTSQDFAHLTRAVKTNNLDVTIKNDPETNWYIERRFGYSSTSWRYTCEDAH